MRKLLVKAQTRVGAVVIGGAVVVLGAGGLATAAVMTPATDERSDVSTVTTEPVETTAPTVAVIPEPQTNPPAPVPADSPAADTPAASVEDVTEPEQTTPPASDPAIGTTGGDGNYTPAPVAPLPNGAGAGAGGAVGGSVPDVPDLPN